MQEESVRASFQCLRESREYWPSLFHVFTFVALPAGLTRLQVATFGREGFPDQCYLIWMGISWTLHAYHPHAWKGKICHQQTCHHGVICHPSMWKGFYYLLLVGLSPSPVTHHPQLVHMGRCPKRVPSWLQWFMFALLTHIYEGTVGLIEGTHGLDLASRLHFGHPWIMGSHDCISYAIQWFESVALSSLPSRLHPILYWKVFKANPLSSGHMLEKNMH